MFFLSLLLCLGNAFDVSQHLASKSPYGDRGYAASQQATPPPATCVPVHINLLSRHGSRYPTKGSIRNYLALEATLHNLNATNPNYSWLNDWKCQYNTITAGQLLPLGEDELYSLGKRLTSQYPEIFQGVEYNPRFFPIRTTQKPRAAQSGTAFGYSVFEGQGHLGEARFLPFYIHSASADSDKILYFHNICPAYLLYLETKVHKAEYALYVETRLSQVVQSVLTKVGSTSKALSPYHVIFMYELCSLGTLAKNSDTDFCSLFEEEDFELLEYADDLESYWKKFYGKDINWQMSAQLLQDMVNEMNLAATGGAKATRGSFRFAHGETMAPLLGLLGLYRDQPPLHHDLPLHTMLSRKWRQSQILPMGANLMTVLYNCSNEAVVKFLVNEAEVKLPRCDNVYCSLERFKKLYADELSINYDEICDVSDSGVRPPLAAVGAFFVITGALGVCAVCFKEQRAGLGSDRNGNGRGLGKRMKLKPEN